MASQALYRKWRSQTFEELVGQEEVVRTLKNALQSGRIAHAYLFCGPRGTGKTSVARLLAKTVNCQNPRQGEPCNVCPNCREIIENRSLDVIEIDAASNRGIDEIRDLRDKVAIRPANSKYKVYVLDEAHMLTTDACNALLKTLEEPPAYVIFVLATTEAQRMLPTIVSRCQRFDFKRHTFRNTVRHLQYVAEQEGVRLEGGAAEALARAAGGGMRDALSLLDQAMAAMGQTVTQAGVQQMLGLADPRLVRELVEHVAYLRGADGLHLINRLTEAGADLRQLSAQVADYWRAMMLARAGADVVAVLDRSPEEAAEIRQLAELFALDELSACARLFAQNDVGARAITIPQLAVELAFIDCLHLHRQRTGAAGNLPGSLLDKAATSPPPPARSSAETIREAAAPVMRAEPLLAAAVEEGEKPDLGAAPGSAALPEPLRSARQADEPSSQMTEETAAAGEAVVSSEVAEDAGPEAASSPASVQPGLTLEMAISQWGMVKKVCRTRTTKLAALLNNVVPVAVTGPDGCELVLEVEYDFHYERLLEPESRRVVEWALKEIHQVPCRARFLLKGSPIPVSGPASGQPGAARSAARAAPSRMGLPPDAPIHPVSNAMPIRRAANDLTSQNGRGASAQPGHARAAPASGPPVNSLEAQVRQDPVVEEIIKTYGAKLVEWKPLGEEI